MSAAIIAQAGAGLLSFLQGLTSSNSTAATPASNTSGGAVATAGQKHKHGGGFEKLANAITGALQSAISGGSADVNKTITDALTKIFQNGSLNPNGETDPAADGQTPSTDGTSNANGGLPDTFVQTLQSFGVSAQQFQKDLGAALQAAEKSGKLDLSAIFKSFPAGSAVDAVG